MSWNTFSAFPLVGLLRLGSPFKRLGFPALLLHSLGHPHVHHEEVLSRGRAWRGAGGDPVATQAEVVPQVPVLANQDRRQVVGWSHVAVVGGGGEVVGGLEGGWGGEVGGLGCHRWGVGAVNSPTGGVHEGRAW